MQQQQGEVFPPCIQWKQRASERLLLPYKRIVCKHLLNKTLPLKSIPEKGYKCKDQRVILQVLPTMNCNEHLGQISVKSPVETWAEKVFPSSSQL